MKRILFLTLAIMLIKSVDSYGLSFSTSPLDTLKLPETHDNGSPKKVFNFVEQSPTFPGGAEALMKFLNEQTNQPLYKGIEGRVLVSFVIDKDGQIMDSSIKRKLSPLADQAAMDIINKMPQWIPGRQNGKNVAVMYNLPISFKKH